MQHSGATFGKDSDKPQHHSRQLWVSQPALPPSIPCVGVHIHPGPLCSSPVPELILHSGRQTRLAETRCQHIPPCPLGISGPAAAARQPWDPAAPPAPTPRAHQHNSPSPSPLSHPISLLTAYACVGRRQSNVNTLTFP